MHLVRTQQQPHPRRAHRPRASPEADGLGRDHRDRHHLHHPVRAVVFPQQRAGRCGSAPAAGRRDRLRRLRGPARRLPDQDRRRSRHHPRAADRGQRGSARRELEGLLQARPGLHRRRAEDQEARQDHRGPSAGLLLQHSDEAGREADDGTEQHQGGNALAGAPASRHGHHRRQPHAVSPRGSFHSERTASFFTRIDNLILVLSSSE